MKTEHDELLDAFKRLGATTNDYVEAQHVATQASARLTRATKAVNEARSAIVKLINRYDVASPGNYGFEKRLADLLAFFAEWSVVHGELKHNATDRPQTENENVSIDAEVQL